jgi:hypothetical protein
MPVPVSAFISSTEFGGSGDRLKSVGLAPTFSLTTILPNIFISFYDTGFHLIMPSTFYLPFVACVFIGVLK